MKKGDRIKWLREIKDGLRGGEMEVKMLVGGEK